MNGPETARMPKGYLYQRETYEELANVPFGTVSARSAQLGATEHEPLLVGMDALLRYAKAYRHRFAAALSDDYVLGPAWLDAALGLRALCKGDGAVAYERDISTDSKDNGTIESIFWVAMKAAGFQESDL